MVSRRKFLYSLGALGSLACAGSLVSLAGMGSAKRIPERTETRLMMGTFVSITARNESRVLVDEALDQAFAEIGKAEALFTRHNTASPLGVLNQQGVLHDAPRPVVSLLGESLRLFERTSGGFNPATASVLGALAAHGAASVESLPASVQADLAVLTDPSGIQLQGNTIRLRHSGMGVSLDGIAKGHIVDLAAARLESRGVADYIVNAGGDVRAGSSSSQGQVWTVGIQDGANPTENVATVRLRSGAMATSGNYESLASKGYNHLVCSGEEDLPARTSVTVTAPTCAEADSMATALFAMGVVRGMEHVDLQPGYASLWQTENGLVSSKMWGLV